MKELIEKYKEAIAFNKQRAKEENEAMENYHLGLVSALEDVIYDLESLQSKGKTKEEVFNEQASKIMKKFWLLEFKQQYPTLLKAIYASMEEYAQSHANQDGWVSVEERLPEKAEGANWSDEVVAYCMNGECYTVAHNGESWQTKGEMIARQFGKVLLWMPLPKPPQP